MRRNSTICGVARSVPQARAPPVTRSARGRQPCRTTAALSASPSARSDGSGSPPARSISPQITATAATGRRLPGSSASRRQAAARAGASAAPAIRLWNRHCDRK